VGYNQDICQVKGYKVILYPLVRVYLRYSPHYVRVCPGQWLGGLGTDHGSLGLAAVNAASWPVGLILRWLQAPFLDEGENQPWGLKGTALPIARRGSFARVCAVSDRPTMTEINRQEYLNRGSVSQPQNGLMLTHGQACFTSGRRLRHLLEHLGDGLQSVYGATTLPQYSAFRVRYRVIRGWHYLMFFDIDLFHVLP